MTDYNTILSKRKTICIQIHSKGVTIKAPADTPQSVVQDCISKKQSWIDKKLKEQEEAKNKSLFNYRILSPLLLLFYLGQLGEQIYFPPYKIFLDA